MKIVGKTTEKKIVVANVFLLFDTYGLPLVTIFDFCKENDFVISWLDFYNEAKLAGWEHKTIISRLSDSICDVWGDEYRNAVMSRLTVMSN